MKKSVIYIVLCLLISSCSKRSKPLTETAISSDIISDREALELINKIASVVKTDTTNTRFEYNNYCGGLYINESKKVVVIIVGDTAFYRKTISDKIGRNDFIVQSGKYSYNMLKSILAELALFWQDAKNENIIQEVRLKQFGLDIRNNNIYIKLQDINKTQIDLFRKKVMDSPVFVFENSSGAARFE